MRDGERVSERVLTHEPNARIHVRYRVIQDWEGAPHRRAQHVSPDRTAHLFPSDRRSRAGHAGPAPRDTDTPAHTRHAARLALRVRPAAPRPRARACVGEHHRRRRLSHPPSARTAPSRVAIRGDWSFTDEAFTAQVADIIGGHRAFWGDRSAPYLVTVTQTVQRNRRPDERRRHGPQRCIRVLRHAECRRRADRAHARARELPHLDSRPRSAACRRRTRPPLLVLGRAHGFLHRPHAGPLRACGRRSNSPTISTRCWRPTRNRRCATRRTRASSPTSGPISTCSSCPISAAASS